MTTFQFLNVALYVTYEGQILFNFFVTFCFYLFIKFFVRFYILFDSFSLIFFSHIIISIFFQKNSNQKEVS